MLEQQKIKGKMVGNILKTNLGVYDFLVVFFLVVFLFKQRNKKTLIQLCFGSGSWKIMWIQDFIRHFANYDDVA